MFSSVGVVGFGSEFGCGSGAESEQLAASGTAGGELPFAVGRVERDVTVVGRHGA